MDSLNTFFLIIALLLFISVVASRVSSRFGMPLLLVFLVVGMLAGEEGLGGIKFDNFAFANMVGQLALAIILLDGGLRPQLGTLLCDDHMTGVPRAPPPRPPFWPLGA